MPAPSNKGQRFPARPLTPQEIQAVIGACSMRAPTGVRNAALLSLLHRSGLRCSEALALRPRHVDLEDARVDVDRGKGDKSRVVYLTETDCLPYIARWLDIRPGNGHGALFCTLDGAPMNDSYVRHLCARLGAKAGITGRVHPHAFRHTFARDLLRMGATVEDLRAQLGHASLEVTARYVREVCPEDRGRRIATLRTVGPT